METYEETIESYQEAISLGYSHKSVIEMIEDDENANTKALEVLKDNA